MSIAFDDDAKLNCFQNNKPITARLGHKHKQHSVHLHVVAELERARQLAREEVDSLIATNKAVEADVAQTVERDRLDRRILIEP